MPKALSIILKHVKKKQVLCHWLKAYSMTYVIVLTVLLVAIVKLAINI